MTKTNELIVWEGPVSIDTSSTALQDEGLVASGFICDAPPPRHDEEHDFHSNPKAKVQGSLFSRLLLLLIALYKDKLMRRALSRATVARATLTQFL